MNQLADLSARIEATYRMIAQTRMAGIPIVHPGLDVAVRGLQHHGSNQVCILVTPWFMNLVFLPIEQPGEQGCEAVPRIGSSRSFVLPSGCYDALAGYEDGLGWHWSTSLFSPMFEFGDMESAIETADVSLELLFTAPDGSRQRGTGHEQGEDFREAMVHPAGAGNVDQRLAVIEREEAEQAARLAAEAQQQPATAVPSGMNRRELFGLGRQEGAARG